MSRNQSRTRRGHTRLAMFLSAGALTVAGLGANADGGPLLDARRPSASSRDLYGSRSEHVDRNRRPHYTADWYPIRHVGGGLHRRTIKRAAHRRLGLREGRPQGGRELSYSDGRRASQYSSIRRW